MDKKKITKKEKLFDDIQSIFARAHEKHIEDPDSLRYEKMINRISDRHRMIKEHFSDEKSLETYIKEHKSSCLVRKRIKNMVTAKNQVIKKLAKKEEFKDIENKTDESKFIALVLNYYPVLDKVFPEIPKAVSLCDVKGFVEWYSSQKLTDEELAHLKKVIWEAIREVIESVCNNWQAITGSQLDLSRPDGLPDLNKLPWLGEVEPFKVPVPLRPAWSNKLYSQEAKRMGHRSVVDSINQESRQLFGVNATSGSNLNENAETARTNAESNEREGNNGEDGNANNKACKYMNEICGIDKFNLYDQENLTPLQSPNPPDKPRYTFPGELLRAEDIFYDYCLILPLPEDDCGPCAKEIVGPEPRNLIAAQVLSGKAIAILKFLEQVGLAHVLGYYSDRSVVREINFLLDTIVQMSPTAPIIFIRQKKLRLKEMSGLIRLISRTEMFLFDLDIVNPKEYLEELRSGIKGIDDLAYNVRSTRLPSTDVNENIFKNTLYFKNAEDYRAAGNRDNKNYNRWGINVPDAIKYTYWHPEDPGDDYPLSISNLLHGTGGWSWRLHVEQRHDLRNYVAWLGERFKPKLDSLMSAARTMLDAVDTYAGGGEYDKFKTDFEFLASGLINNAAIALSHLLNEIAEQLTLPKETPVEGSKRLALQVIFRQYWHPTGYVQGKLVGYKNLLPNQKDTLKRRTFVKTTREMTAAEEFATARQDDYSHSQKESAEVAREASSKFNFSASTSGDYDFLVASGEYTLEAGGELANASKTTQKRMTESVRKGSAKYNEKREVKIRELTEVEDVQEVSTEIENTNAEITANYFYYQLLRQYRVTVDLHDLRPILLRTRDVPSPAEIDDHFISTYMHILLHHLPNQLSVDAQENAERLGMLAKTLIRRKADMDQRAAELEVLRGTGLSADTAEANREREERRSKERELYEARQAYTEVEEEYTKASTRMNRVITHIRENICYYMQFIWQESPKVDQDQILREEEFGGYKLPMITRGLIRQGYYGNEEIFNYTGPSYTLLESVLDNLIPGAELCSQLVYQVENERLSAEKEQKLAHTHITPITVEVKNAKLANGRPVGENDFEVDYGRGVITFVMSLDRNSNPTISYETYEDLANTTLFQYLSYYYPEDSDAELKEKICGMAFPRDPANPDPENPEPVLSSATVQVAQDALVVETMPGQVPLLEGFQMAHRMLDVQKSCLENVHLAERIADKPWEKAGEDTYAVRRYEGAGPSRTEENE